MILGGVLSEGPGWRWIFFVNPSLCHARPRDTRFDPRRAPPHTLANFDVLGAVLVTGGMLLLTYALIDAPTVGWGQPDRSAASPGQEACSRVCCVRDARRPRPARPARDLPDQGPCRGRRHPGARESGIFTMFFFSTLFMQNILLLQPIQTGFAYVPIAARRRVAAGISSQLFPRTGTRPIIVAGAVLAESLLWISGSPVHGSYVSDLLPPFVMSRSVSGCLRGVQTAANAGVPAEIAPASPPR